MAHPRKSRWRRLDRTPIILSALTLTAVLNTAGCFGGGDQPSSPQPSAEQSAAVESKAPADVTVSTLTGRLTPAESKQARTEVGGVVLKWFNDAYLVGDYPRAGAGQAFGTFTTGARQQATRNAALLSNARIGARIDSVTATRRTVRLDLLAVKHQVVGATARVALVFTTTGGYAKTVSIKGSLFLTPGSRGGWRIFGYQLTRGDR